MSYEVTLTPEAKHDLREIYRYIAVELQSEQNANGQLDRLEENILKLDEMPERFRVYDREPWSSRNLRVMPVDNYLVFYIPNHQVKTVTVLCVMYGGRDIDAQLRKMQGNCIEFWKESSHRLFSFAWSNPGFFYAILKEVTTDGG